MIYLTGLRRRADDAEAAAFPLSLPLIRDLGELAFTTPVTFLVGENGSGKSTLLEGIAAGVDAVAVGARILLAEAGALREAAWEGLEHVRVMRAFLADPQAVLAKLLG